MHYCRWIQIILKIFENELNILNGGLDKINGSDTVQLLSILFDVEVKGDIVLSKIFHLENWRNDIMVKLIEDYYFPGVVLFGEYLFEQLFLTTDQIYLWLVFLHRVYYVISIYSTFWIINYEI